MQGGDVKGRERGKIMSDGEGNRREKERRVCVGKGGEEMWWRERTAGDEKVGEREGAHWRSKRPVAG